MKNYNSTSNFARELEELRSAYLQTLPQKVEVVQQAWEALNAEQWNPADYESVYRLIHNLAGGAGTYGFTAITAEARKILNTMKPWMHSEVPPASELQLQINQGFEILEKATHQAVNRVNKQTHHLRKPPGRKQGSEVQVSEIFLVEDDLDQARFLKLMLEQAGHRVQVFDNLKDVRMALQALEPTAILMDMMFPEGELAGARTIEEIQEDRAIPIPIIFISTRSDLEARLQAVRAGAWHYFSKPVNVSNLINTLDRYVKPETKKTRHVLLVDDDPAVSALFASHLEQIDGLTASLLSEPFALLKTMESQKPDMILMDYYMPGCNGLELAAVIRQHEQYANIPIIFLTEETNIETQLTALNLGSDDFFTKSMGPERLVIAVQSRLERLERLSENARRTGWRTH